MKLKFSLVLLILMLFGVSGTAFAHTSSNSVEVEFNFAPVLSLDLSNNELVISNLVPGGTGVSDDIDITVTTNNVSGYELTANVGNSNNTTRNLVHTTANANFASIDINANLASLTTDSTWGYSKDSGSHYSGLPLYTDQQNVALLNDSDGAANEITNFLIGAKASLGQVAGTYTNVINFLAVAKPEPYPYMQDVTQADVNALSIGDVITLQDSRTNENYEVTALELNGTKTLWMNSNLKLPAGTVLTSQNSNVSSNFTLTTDAWGGYYCKQAMAVIDGEYYYNWYAITANPYDPSSDGITPGTSYCGDESRSLGDICPKGWRLPSGSEVTASTWRASVESTLEVTGSYTLLGGEPYLNDSEGFWWSSDHDSIHARFMAWNGSTSRANTTMYYTSGSARCVYNIDE